MNMKEIWRLLFLIFLGQLISLFLAVCSFTSSLIVNLGADTPLTQSFFTYLSLTLVYGSILLYRRQKLLVTWYWYIGLAIADVQGNFLGGKKPLLGDALVIAGTLCYAVSNVGEEFCVKKKDQVEVVAMLGIFGLLVCTTEIAIFERKDLQEVKWSPTVISLFAGFAAASFLFYSITPFFLKMSGATLFNLSLLTSDMWAVVIRIFFYGQQVDWLYFLAFGVAAIGLIIYSVNEAGINSAKDDEGEEVTIQNEQFTEENSTTPLLCAVEHYIRKFDADVEVSSVM